MDPRTCTLARLTASQNNISLLTNLARVPMPEASQTPLWLQIPNSKLHSLFENATPSAIWGGLAGQKTQWRGLVLNLSHVGNLMFWPVNIQTISNLILLWTHNWYLKFCSSVSCTKRVRQNGTRCGASWFNPRKLRGRDFKIDMLNSVKMQ